MNLNPRRGVIFSAIFNPNSTNILVCCLCWVTPTINKSATYTASIIEMMKVQTKEVGSRGD